MEVCILFYFFYSDDRQLDTFGVETSLAWGEAVKFCLWRMSFNTVLPDDNKTFISQGSFIINHVPVITHHSCWMNSFHFISIFAILSLLSMQVHNHVCVYVCKYLCLRPSVALLQGDEGPLGPPGSSGPTVSAPRFSRWTYTVTHAGVLKETIRSDVLLGSSCDVKMPNAFAAFWSWLSL